MKEKTNAGKHNNDKKEILSLPKLNESAIELLNKNKYLTILLLQNKLKVPFRFATEIIANLEYAKVIKQHKDFGKNGKWISNDVSPTDKLNENNNDERSENMLEEINSNLIKEEDKIEQLISETTKLVKSEDYISVSLLQKKFSISFPKAVEIIDTMLDRNIICKVQDGKYISSKCVPSEDDELKADFYKSINVVYGTDIVKVKEYLQLVKVFYNSQNKRSKSFSGLPLNTMPSVIKDSLEQFSKDRYDIYYIEKYDVRNNKEFFDIVNEYSKLNLKNVKIFISVNLVKNLTINPPDEIDLNVKLININ